MRFLLPLFIITPIVEMYVLLQVGGLIGPWPTIGLVLLTAMIGLQLLKQQGASTLIKLNEKLSQGNLPAEEIISGFLLAIGGALLLTPGFVTDTIGFALLLPITRKPIAQHLIQKGMVSAFNQQGFSQSGTNSGFYYQSQQYQTSGQRSAGGDIIDGEAVEVKDDNLLNK